MLGILETSSARNRMLRAEYVRDLSVENPMGERLPAGVLPEINLEIQTATNPYPDRPDIVEVALRCRLEANVTGEEDKKVTWSVIEMVYAATFSLEGIDQDEREPYTMVHFPQLIFPGLVANMRHAGQAIGFAGDIPKVDFLAGYVTQNLPVVMGKIRQLAGKNASVMEMLNGVEAFLASRGVDLGATEELSTWMAKFVPHVFSLFVLLRRTLSFIQAVMSEQLEQSIGDVQECLAQLHVMFKQVDEDQVDDDEHVDSDDSGATANGGAMSMGAVVSPDVKINGAALKDPSANELGAGKPAAALTKKKAVTKKPAASKRAMPKKDEA